MVDARILNTEAALSSAILTLAAETPISQITVADVARQAGINRATFYSHFASPSDLLVAVLSSDLDEITRVDGEVRQSGAAPSAQVTRQSFVETVQHVHRFREVYCRALLDPNGGTTRGVLSAVFVRGCTMHIREFVPAERVPGDPDVIVAFLAHGLTGAIEVAIQRDDWQVEELADLLVGLMPAWWD
jgi:AcrR family transcriptional regulator